MDAYYAKKHRIRENRKKMAKQQEEHATGQKGPGGHVPGPMAKCPICREALWRSSGRKR